MSDTFNGIILDQANILISYIDQLRLHYNITTIHNISIIEILDYNNQQYKFKLKLTPSIYLSSYILPNVTKFNTILTNLLNKLSNIDIINIETTISDNDIVISILFKFHTSRILELPNELIYNILINMSYKDIKSYCTSYSNANTFCQSDKFWHEKIEHDSKEKIPYVQGIMEELYLNYSTLGILVPNYTDGIDYIPYKIQFDNIVKSVSNGLSHTVLIDENNRVWSYGSNNSGQLGLGGTKSMADPTKLLNFNKAKSVSGGDNHTMIIDENDELWSCGNNDFGQLGLGNKKGKKVPTKITRFSDISKIQNYYSSDTIASVHKVKAVSCGGRHTIIIDENDEVWSCGDNQFGQLGLGSGINKYTIIPVPTKLSFNNKVKQISSGNDHIMIIDENNEVWSCGSNEHGQLGLGLDNDINKNILTKINFNYKVKYVSCGYTHSMIIDENNELWGFGQNNDGQLGLGDYINKNIPTKIRLNYKTKLVSCGVSYTIIIDENNELWSLGHNRYNQMHHYNDNIPIKVIFDHKVKDISCGGNDTSLILLY
uniref:F-box and regulator of chromosome condensation repeat protein n=1 Tax=Pithovirus LCPAC102 TaxID=2506587 RepID=A0A481Z2Y2_9VIRU|nr:MAG: F-box and regulator of chromosome condensation repeat protein [Pithovirus LCPAC102]